MGAWVSWLLGASVLAGQRQVERQHSQHELAVGRNQWDPILG